MIRMLCLLLMISSTALADPWDAATPVAQGICVKNNVPLRCVMFVHEGVRYLLVTKEGRPIEYIRIDEDGSQTSVWKEGEGA